METRDESQAGSRRSQVLKQLETGRYCRLILLVAPSGSGKTEFLRSWSESGKLRVAWISLRAEDNDPERFWEDWTGALQQAGLGIDSSFPTSECGSSDNAKEEGFSFEDRFVDLINDLAGTPQDFLLVLDNYDVIDTVAIHKAITLMLDYLPEHVRLAIASRSQPPLQISRLRARRQLIELGPEDL